MRPDHQARGRLRGQRSHLSEHGRPDRSRPREGLHSAASRWRPGPDAATSISGSPVGDVVRSNYMPAAINGGGGNDDIKVFDGDVDGGPGDDRLAVLMGTGATGTLTGGEGRDTVVIRPELRSATTTTRSSPTTRASRRSASGSRIAEMEVFEDEEAAGGSPDARRLRLPGLDRSSTPGMVTTRWSARRTGRPHSSAVRGSDVIEPGAGRDIDRRGQRDRPELARTGSAPVIQRPTMIDCGDGELPSTPWWPIAPIA